jgi:hypothetical protein
MRQMLSVLKLKYYKCTDGKFHIYLQLQLQILTLLLLL